MKCSEHHNVEHGDRGHRYFWKYSGHAHAHASAIQGATYLLHHPASDAIHVEDPKSDRISAKPSC